MSTVTYLAVAADGEIYEPRLGGLRPHEGTVAYWASIFTDTIYLALEAPSAPLADCEHCGWRSEHPRMDSAAHGASVAMHKCAKVER